MLLNVGDFASASQEWVSTDRPVMVMAARKESAAWHGTA
jgi:hypothetical protein